MDFFHPLLKIEKEGKYFSDMGPGQEKPSRFMCVATLVRALRVWLSHEIRAAVNGQEISTVQTADTGIPAAASADGTQAADTLEIFFQHGGIVVEVLAIPALALTRCFLFTGMPPPGQIHGEK
jgi:hypothetical protein